MERGRLLIKRIRLKNIFADFQGARSGSYSRGCSENKILGRPGEMGDWGDYWE